MNIMLLCMMLTSSATLISSFIFILYHTRSSNYSFTEKFINLPLRVTKDELAHIEGSIPGLTKVTIICNEMENPRETLSKSVENNAKKGVAYNFWVSPSTAFKQEITRYQMYKQHFANEASDIVTDTILSLRSLSRDWEDSTYIFYTFEKSGKEFTFSYRGVEKLEAIADEYELVSEENSTLIYNDCKNGLRDVNSTSGLTLKNEDVLS
jgi:hypothetical protein